MQQFELILLNEKTRTYRLVRIFILIANAVGMIWLLSRATTWTSKAMSALALVSILFFLFFVFFDVAKKRYSHDTFPRLAYCWCAIAWLWSPLWWFSIPLLLFFIFDILAYRKLIVKVGVSGITYPSLGEKKVKWDELNNVILKDGLLTIDLRNNQLFQHLVANAETDINEKDFNEFCRNHLARPI